MKKADLIGLWEKVKKLFVLEDVPMFHQIFGSFGLAMAGGWLLKVSDPVLFWEWSSKLHLLLVVILAAPYVLKGLAKMSWTLGLCLLWLEEYVYLTMLEVGKFAMFVGGLLGLSAMAAHAGNIHQVLSLPIPEPVFSREWLATYWDHPVFLTLLGLGFVMYCGALWVWRHRPEGLESLNGLRSSWG